ncbi:hypothetical protein [Bacillus sp. JJ722]|uniref:hypothetical protein n=1 Tax=Bacillus sp. JJ722 TaxID=3122973 RepID=UPI002FFEB3F6
MIKKMLVGVSVASVLFAGTAQAASFNGVGSKATKSSPIIKKVEMDVTGDKKADIVTLEGKKVKNGSYENLYVKINNKAQKKTLYIKLFEGGMNPTLQLKDINRDKVQDIHVSYANKTYQKENVYTAKNNKTAKLSTSAKIKSQMKYAANYSFKIPERWKNNFTIQTLEGKNAAKQEAYAQFITTFNFKNGKVSEPLLSIISYKKADWNKLVKDGGPLPEVIAQANNFVYVVQLPQSSPFDPTSKDGKLYEKMVMSFEEVKASFTASK